MQHVHTYSPSSSQVQILFSTLMLEALVMCMLLDTAVVGSNPDDRETTLVPLIESRLEMRLEMR